MEELKILVEAVAKLPALAIWVVAMYFFFKLAVVGSIYGVVRFGIAKLHDMITFRKITVNEHTHILDNEFISRSVDVRVNPLLKKLIQEMKCDGSKYIHASDLETAIVYIKQGKAAALAEKTGKAPSSITKV